MTKSEIEKLARELMDTHGLGNWPLLWCQFKTSFAKCWAPGYRGKLSEWGHIRLSEPLMTQLEEPEVTDVILHEIAHALAPVGSGHSWRWKAVAMRIGANPVRSQDRNAKPIECRYQAECSCGETHHKYRRPERWGVYRCRKTNDVLEFVDTKSP